MVVVQTQKKKFIEDDKEEQKEVALFPSRLLPKQPEKKLLTWSEEDTESSAAEMPEGERRLHRAFKLTCDWHIQQNKGLYRLMIVQSVSHAFLKLPISKDSELTED